MKKYWIIELNSDACVASGESDLGVIDTEIEYREGIPYIPAKRLKGLLREAMDDLILLDFGSEKIRDKFLGKVGSEPAGILKIGNAYLDDENFLEKLDRIRQNRALHGYGSDEKLKNYFTYTRAQTAMTEMGVAKENSLRISRVMARGYCFAAELLLSEKLFEEEEAFLDNAIRTVRHMGSNRSRGWGAVTCRPDVKDEPDVKNDRAVLAAESCKPAGDRKRKALYYRLRLQEECVMETEYVSGQQMLAIFADGFLKADGLTAEEKERSFPDIFLRDQVWFDTAYVCDGDIVMLPAPKSFQYNKKESLSGGIFDMAADDGRMEWDLACAKPFPYPCAGISQGIVYRKTMGRQIHFHHQRPEDRTVGHVLKEESDSRKSGKLFQFETIEAGTEFYGSIRGDAEILEVLRQCVPDGSTVQIGGSRSAQYGKARITYVEKDLIGEYIDGDEEPEAGTRITLLSPMLLRDDFGRTVTDGRAVAGEILKGCVDSLDGYEIRIWSRIREIGGFNAKWGMPRKKEKALEEGTVIYILDLDLDEEQMRRLEEERYGEKTGEGFGRIRMGMPDVGGEYKYRQLVPERDSEDLFNQLGLTGDFLVRRQRVEDLFSAYMKEQLLEEMMECLLLDDKNSYLRKIRNEAEKQNNGFLELWMGLLNSSGTFDEFERQVKKVLERNADYKRQEAQKRMYLALKGEDPSLTVEFDSKSKKRWEHTGDANASGGETTVKDGVWNNLLWDHVADLHKREMFQAYMDSCFYQVFSAVVCNVLMSEKLARRGRKEKR